MVSGKTLEVRPGATVQAPAKALLVIVTAATELALVATVMGLVGAVRVEVEAVGMAEDWPRVVIQTGMVTPRGGQAPPGAGGRCHSIERWQCGQTCPGTVCN
jgi:hypothetical protein